MIKRAFRTMLEPIRKNGRHNVVTALAKGRIVRHQIDGSTINWLITNRGDEIQQHQFSAGFYELEELRQLRDDVGSRRHVLDVGANIGNHSVFFVKLLGARNLVCVEPFAKARNHLLVNLALNNTLMDDLRVLALALGSGQGTATLVEPTEFNIGLTQVRSVDGGDILVATADEIIQDSPLDLVKIDVEGMELDVLQGMVGILSQQRPALYIEASAATRKPVLDFVSQFNYSKCRESTAYEHQFNITLLPT